MTRYYYTRDYDTEESLVIERILLEENPYKWDSERIDYKHEARDIAQHIDSNRIFITWQSVDYAIGAALYEWGCKGWYDGDYAKIAKRILAELRFNASQRF